MRHHVTLCGVNEYSFSLLNLGLTPRIWVLRNDRPEKRLDDVDVVRQQIEEILGLNRQQPDVRLGDGISRAGTAAENVEDPETSVGADHGSRLAAQTHAPFDDAVERVRRVTRSENPLALGEGILTRDLGRTE